jgi:hypothetical protein
MRRLIATVLLLLAATPSDAEMGGAQFLRLCQRDAAPCAGIIRDQLKGWPKHVLDPAKLKRGVVQQSACPPHVADSILADQFVAKAGELRVRLDGMTVHEAVEEIFTQAFPACASSRDS